VLNASEEALRRKSVRCASRLATLKVNHLVIDNVPGLYDRLVTRELKRALGRLAPAQIALDTPDPADVHVAISDHLGTVSSTPSLS